jgi:type IV secretion/conjugal transfer VirB4 family ATPase
MHSTITVFHTDRTTVDEYAQRVLKLVRQNGYGARLETINAVEAFLGSLPGHSVQNLRSVLLHTLNLADLLPTTSVWSGQEEVTNPYFPPHSPALLLGTTTGKSPFFLSPYYGDVGHCLVLGPSGSGKTTLLNMLVAQYLRYHKARVFAFDNKYGMYALCRAVGGWHYDVGGMDKVGIMPLARVEDEQERVWAAEWLEQCLALQGVQVTSQQRKELWLALEKLGHLPGHRTLTDFCATVQDHTIRDGLRHYALSGGGGDLFDCAEASPLTHHFVVCELSHLMQRGDKDLIPAMLYYFHEVERRLDGTPMIIPIEEGWMPLMKSRLGEKLEEWLRMFRDKNAMLVFASQSVSDVAKSTHRDILIEQCPTKLLAPNPEAESASSKQLYLDLGLSEQEIEALRWARPKEEYLYHSPLGRSLFTMGLGRAALSFVGVSGPEHVRAVKTCADQYGEVWPYHHLLARGCKEEAAWWRHDYERRHEHEEPYETLFSSVDTLRPVFGNGAAIQ